MTSCWWGGSEQGRRCPALALDELVLTLADRELPRFRVAGRTLTIALPDATDPVSLQVSTDADQLTTILLNFLDNARKHAAPGAPVTLQLLAPTPSAGPVIEVANALATPLGPHLAQLTTAWYQADPLATGAGLGLWIAGRLAQVLGVELSLAETGQRLVVQVRFPHRAK
jgi:signal transduction histidine kinase